MSNNKSELMEELKGILIKYVKVMEETYSEEIYDKSEKHLQLLKILLIDDYTLLLFGIDPIPYNSNIKGVIKSVCKYLDCKIYEANYIKYLRDMVFDPWGEQNYHYIINDNKAYDLKVIKED